jgi:CBS domain-containing protein
MSARAAARLETLEFGQVYRYQPGKADWFAAGLPREGREAHTPRVADIALRDVPTCRINDGLGAVRERMHEGRWELCVVVDDHRVVLGAVARENGEGDPDAPVELVMQAGPVTFRPHVAVGTLPEYRKTQRIPRALVTTSDGVLIGLLRMDGSQEDVR